MAQAMPPIPAPIITALRRDIFQLTRLTNPLVVKAASDKLELLQQPANAVTTPPESSDHIIACSFAEFCSVLRSRNAALLSDRS